MHVHLSRIPRRVRPLPGVPDLPLPLGVLPLSLRPVLLLVVPVLLVPPAFLLDAVDARLFALALPVFRVPVPLLVLRARPCVASPDTDVSPGVFLAAAVDLPFALTEVPAGDFFVALVPAVSPAPRVEPAFPARDPTGVVDAVVLPAPARDVVLEVSACFAVPASGFSA